MKRVRFPGCESDFLATFSASENQSLEEIFDQCMKKAEASNRDNLLPHKDVFLKDTTAIGHGVYLVKTENSPEIPILIAFRSEDEVKLIFCVNNKPEDPTVFKVIAEFAALAESPKFRELLRESQTPAQLVDIFTKAVENSINFETEDSPELTRTGRPFGCLLADLKRKTSCYLSDFSDGFNLKVLASTVFLYFACIAPAIAFGALLNQQTNGAVGVMEMIAGTALCGIVYALTSAQPLTILGSTGPVIIFLGILFEFCEMLGVPYLPAFSIVGLWTMVFLIVAVLFDGCVWIRFFTRFTDETFAALISLIFIYEAGHNILGKLTEHSTDEAQGLLALLLALTTYTVASKLVKLRHSIYLRRFMREFCADFGPTIAIMVATLLAFCFSSVQVETLNVPDTFGTTSGRPWIINPFESPWWFWIAGMLPAFLVSILLYLDQNITVRLVNDPRNNLQKGGGYHLDLFIVAVLVGVCSIFGLPWMVAATVRSLNHVRSLSQVELRDGKERVTGVLENRISGFAIHALVGLSLLILPLLSQIPLPVLFGLFLFMGVASMGGNQLFERINLLVADPKRYAPTYYLRVVPLPRVHLYTTIQLLCLLTLWVVKTSILGILFPLFIGLLIPVRFALEKFFTPLDLLLLDAEVDPDSEENRLD